MRARPIGCSKHNRAILRAIWCAHCIIWIEAIGDWTNESNPITRIIRWASESFNCARELSDWASWIEKSESANRFGFVLEQSHFKEVDFPERHPHSLRHLNDVVVVVTIGVALNDATSLKLISRESVVGLDGCTDFISWARINTHEHIGAKGEKSLWDWVRFAKMLIDESKDCINIRELVIGTDYISPLFLAHPSVICKYHLHTFIFSLRSTNLRDLHILTYVRKKASFGALCISR